MIDKKGLKSMLIFFSIIILLLIFSNQLNFLPYNIRSVILILFILIFVFYESTRPIKDLKDINRVYQRKSLFSKKKALETLKEGLKLENLNYNERLLLHIKIAVEYYNMKDYANAYKSFKKVVEEILKNDNLKIEEKFLIKLIGTYILNDKKEEAKKIYYRLLSLGRCEKSKLVEDMIKS
ncbi:hypothetical protein SAMN05660865_00484 [Caloramator fervidus]|uniref:Tetratricopeptide repeat-containing protein n=1 Tax=Caloramator fervidus TaxID=29344 RepID=A0A1H5SZ39_9CLOT|nr:hypothetical protein [Caloramator fervidus]SEF55111.1 hypothetical protein SAMN05660865_00484 [Caloramator fervidus]